MRAMRKSQRDEHLVERRAGLGYAGLHVVANVKAIGIAPRIDATSTRSVSPSSRYV